jgi:RNA polymerase sigma factor (sigma-70 family)
MATAQLGGTLRRVFDRVRDSADGGDGELLTRYRTLRDQDAFGSLVRRHGPMVLGVCRRVLRDYHAADDAFQATFLVLARKADAVRPPDRLAPWLYGVAYRTALKARGRAFRRQQVEQEYAAAGRSSANSPDEAADLRPVIDEQLNALPEKYRTPLVLCAIQGLNKAEAAERLGLPEGTVSSRLARAREMLRDRLLRRGVVVPAAALAALLAADTLQAAVPPALASSAAEVAFGSAAAPATVLTLTHEVIRSMTLLKLKLLTAVALSVSLAGGGFGLIAVQAQEKKPAKPADGEKPAVKPEKPVEKPGEKPAEKPNQNEKNGQNNQNGNNEKNGQNNQNGEGNKPKPLPRDGEKPKPEVEKPLKPAPVDGEKVKPVGEKPAGKFGGKIVAVNAEANTITLASKGLDGEEMVVKLAADAKVFVDGKEAKLANVPTGAFAGIVFAGGKDGTKEKVASEVRVTGSTATGILKEVDASSITLAAEKAARVYKITAGTKVTVDGKDAKVADLKAGDKVTVTLTADEAAVLTIGAGSAKPDGEKPVKPGVVKPKPEKPIPPDDE